MRSPQKSDLCHVLRVLLLRKVLCTGKSLTAFTYYQGLLLQNPNCFLTWDTAEVTFLALLPLASL